MLDRLGFGPTAGANVRAQTFGAVVHFVSLNVDVVAIHKTSCDVPKVVRELSGARAS
jgi:hypothetical protein